MYWLLRLGIPAALALWAFVIEPGFGHHTKEYPITIKKLERNNYKIAILADLHIGSPWNHVERLEKIVDTVNEQTPDLILVAGDFVIHEVLGGKFVPPEKLIPALSRLRAKEGVYAVLGNHDHWLNGTRVTKALETANISVLTNKVILKDGFWLAGVDDLWAGKPDVDGTLSQVKDDKPILLFTHNPDLFPKIPKRVDLSIAGHTHGGQVYFPLLGRPIVPSDYGERYALGLIQEDGHQLFVNPGTGTSILPVRFLVPPEVSILIINPTTPEKY